jgi:hypothetical protein
LVVLPDGATGFTVIQYPEDPSSFIRLWYLSLGLGEISTGIVFMGGVLLLYNLTFTQQSVFIKCEGCILQSTREFIKEN